MMQELINFLSEFATDKRNEQFRNVIANRTRYITVVLEDIFQPHNASAVLRTCDCFGVQDVHIIENENKFSVEEGVAMGSSKWLTLHKYNKESFNTIDAINSLKKKGYRIVATTPHTNDVPLADLNVEKGKIAVLFGTEMHGLTKQALEHSDEFLRIPMFGFTESFNISVSAALVMHNLVMRVREQNAHWKLTEPEAQELLLSWLKKSIKSSKQLEEKFMTLNHNSSL